MPVLVVAAIVAVGGIAYFLLFGQGTEGKGPYAITAATISSSSQYTHPDGSFSATLPTGWDMQTQGSNTVITNANEDAVVLVYLDDENLADAIAAVRQGRAGSDPAPKDVLDEYYQRLGASNTGVEFGTANIAGQERAGLLGEEKTENLKGVVEVIKTGSDYWLVLWGGSLDTWATDGPVLRFISDSLRFPADASSRPTATPATTPRPTSSPTPRITPTPTQAAGAEWKDITYLFTGSDTRVSLTGNVSLLAAGNLLSIQVIEGEEIDTAFLSWSSSDISADMRATLLDKGARGDDVTGQRFTAPEGRPYVVRLYFEDPPDYVIAKGDVGPIPIATPTQDFEVIPQRRY